MSTTTTPTGITDLGNNKFKVRVYDPRDGRRLVETVTGIAEAKRTHARLRAEVQRVGGRAKRGTAPTVEEFGERWRTVLSPVPGSENGLEGALRIHIYPTLGQRRVDRVTYLDAMRWTRDLNAGPLAISTRGRIDTHARALFDAIAAEGWLEVSPFVKVPRVKVSRTAARRQGEYVPTLAQALDLAEMARAEGRTEVWAFIRIAVGTGLRGGEVVGLSVDELDYPAPTWLEVRHQLQFSSAHGGFFLCTQKSDAGSRWVPVVPAVAETLAVLSAYRAPNTVTLPWFDKGRHAFDQERQVALVFSGRYNATAPVQEVVMARAVRALAERAGLPGRVTPHSLRRTYTTVLHDAGVPLRTIDCLTGHESDGLTLGTYTEVTPKSMAKARRKIEKAFTAAASATNGEGLSTGAQKWSEAERTQKDWSKTGPEPRSHAV